MTKPKKNYIPDPVLQKRKMLSKEYLLGSGIEIGALHYPLWSLPQVSVKYVDRMTITELRKHYPEVDDIELVEPDIVDDGESLSTFSSNSLDFIIGNHFLEHCQNPLGTIRNHLSKLYVGGILYYAIPDKRLSFDKDRPLTDFEHLVNDDKFGPKRSRTAHYEEWTRLVANCKTPEEKVAYIQRLEEIDYSIHFHVWDQETFRDFINRSQTYLQEPFAIRKFESNDTEIIAILEKTN